MQQWQHQSCDLLFKTLYTHNLNEHPQSSSSSDARLSLSYEADKLGCAAVIDISAHLDQRNLA